MGERMFKTNTAPQAQVGRSTPLPATAPPRPAVQPVNQQLEALAKEQPTAVLRQLLSTTIQKQATQQRPPLGTTTPLGGRFLATLNTSPFRDVTKAKLLQQAIEHADLPDWVRVEVIRTAVAQKRYDADKGQKLIAALQNKPDQVEDFGAALVSRGVDTLRGLLKLAKFVAWDQSTIRMIVDFEGYKKQRIEISQTAQAIIQNPGLLWAALTQEYKDAWAKGEKGKALGYLTFDVGTLVIGGEGTVKAAAAVTEKLTVVMEVGKGVSGKLTTYITEVGDGISRGMGGGLEPALATAGGKAPATTARTAPQVNTASRTGTGAALDPRDLEVAKLMGHVPGNFAQVRNLIGMPFDAAKLPKTYYVKNMGGVDVIVRKTADDKLFTPLTIDSKGRVQINVSQRLSNPSTMKKNFKAAWGKLPDGHWIHHLIPDTLIRNHNVGKILQKLGFNVDEGRNLLNLPGKGVFDENVDVVGHWTDHPEYTRYVRGRLDVIEAKYKPLDALLKDKVKAKNMMDEVRDLEDALREKIKNGDFKKRPDGSLAEAPGQQERSQV